MFEASPVVVVIGALAAYLAGTIPTASWVAGRRGLDPTTAGSGNPGASNVYRLAGRRAGAAVLAIDLLKGLVPAGIALVLDGRELALLCGTAAVFGHVLPLQRPFRGGKGVATASGVALVAWPLVSAALVAVFVAAARIAGAASVGSLAIAGGLPVGVALAGRPAWEIATATALALLVVVRHAGNIRRLTRGEENRIDRARPVRPPASPRLE